MIRGTTPTLTFRIKNENVDLTQAKNVYVTIAKPTKKLTKTGDDLSITERSVAVFLTQEESLALPDGDSVEAQINWTYLHDDGVTVLRGATKPAKFLITKQLLPKVIE